MGGGGAKSLALFSAKRCGVSLDRSGNWKGGVGIWLENAHSLLASLPENPEKTQ